MGTCKIKQGKQANSVFLVFWILYFASYIFRSYNSVMKTAVIAKRPSINFVRGNWRKVLLIALILFLVLILWTPFRQSLSRNPNLDYKIHDPVTFHNVTKQATCVWIQGKCRKDLPESFIPGKGLTMDRHRFYFNGRPFQIISGSFHYFRVHPSQWGDRLLKMRAAGLNTVSTYIPWNLHEQVKGQYDFSGLWNLAAFIEQVATLDLKLIVRPGPYICAEWEYGGFPSWLMNDPNMIVRSSKYEPFLNHVDDYFAQLFPLLAEYQYKTSDGPIIAFQVENEFGTQAYYGESDPEYLLFIKKQFDKWGIVETLFTADGSFGLANGSVPDVLSTVNIMGNPYGNLQELKTFQPEKPLFVGEVYCGWYDRWREDYHQHTDMEECAQLIMEILCTNASVNIYMFAGGTNFGFWNGANNGSEEDYYPVTTSYDYDAPISETGELTPKFFMLRSIIKLMGLGQNEWPPIPDESHKIAYGTITISEYLEYEDMIECVNNVQYLPKINTMEYLDINNYGGQGYGWILYRKVFINSSQLVIHGKIEDRAHVLVNHKLVAIAEWNKWKSPYVIELTGETDIVDILVENNGRVNFKHRLNEQRKGIDGYIEVDGQITTDWLHVPFEFDMVLYEELSMSIRWKPYSGISMPAVYRGTFTIQGLIADTFIDMVGWGKGIVFINGFNIGRYWRSGPQRTLYVPEALVHPGSNDILIFELEQSRRTTHSTDQHLLGPTQFRGHGALSGSTTQQERILRKMYKKIRTEWHSVESLLGLHRKT